MSKPIYSQATDYIYLNALSRLSGIKDLPNDLDRALDLIFLEHRIFKVPDIYNMSLSSVRYPCIANFSSPTFHKTELYDWMESFPDNFFLIMDAFASGKDSLFVAFNQDYITKLLPKLKNNTDILYVTRIIDNKTKQLIALNSLKN